MTKTEEAAARIVEVLQASGLGPDEQIKALGRARNVVTRPFAQPVRFAGAIEKAKKKERQKNEREK